MTCPIVHFLDNSTPDLYNEVGTRLYYDVYEDMEDRLYRPIEWHVRWRLEVGLRRVFTDEPA